MSVTILFSLMRFRTVSKFLFADHLTNPIGKSILCSSYCLSYLPGPYDDETENDISFL